MKKINQLISVILLTVFVSNFSCAQNSSGPTVEIISTIVSNSNFENVDVIFSEEVVGFEISDIQITNGHISDIFTWDNVTFRIEVTYEEPHLEPFEDGVSSFESPMLILIPSGAAKSLSGVDNLESEEYSIYFDFKPPTIQIVEGFRVSKNIIPIQIWISEEFTGQPEFFGVDDVKISDVKVTNGLISDFTTDGFNIIPLASGEVTVNIGANVIYDFAGNSNLDAAVEFKIIVDPDTVTITTPLEGSVIESTEIDNVTISGVSLGKENSSDMKLTISGFTTSDSYSETVNIGNDGAWSVSGIDLSGFDSGEYNIVVEGSDSFGFTLLSNSVSITIQNDTLNNNIINENESSLTILNPVKEELIINGNDVVQSVFVYSVSGILVANSVDVSKLNSGIYIALIKTNKGVVTKKMIKE